MTRSTRIRSRRADSNRRSGGAWAAAGLATTQVLAPRFGRLLTWTLAGAAINDFLQAGFVALTAKANELER